MARKKYEQLRIEPISCFFGTAAGGGAVGSTIGGGVVDVSKSIGDFSVLVGVYGVLGTVIVMSSRSGTAANVVSFAVYESTAATHAGSAISGATVSMGAATAGTLRGLYDAFVIVSSLLTTTQTITINGFAYHTTLTGPGQDGSAVSAELRAKFNGSAAGYPKIPHYKTHSTGGGFMEATALLYIAPDDDQATGLTIVMSAVTATIVPYWNKLQGIIDVNAHALSTNRPKFISVRNTTFQGGTSVVYSFLLRDGGPTPGALVSVNT